MSSKFPRCGNLLHFKLLQSSVNSSESKLFGYKNVWEVAQILFLATIVNAIIGITFSFLLDIFVELGGGVGDVLV